MRCAILDDYQNVALTYGDFAGTSLELTVFNAPLPAETINDALRPFEVIVAMRERTPFDAARLAALPNLKLLVTTGMRNAAIDMAAAAARGITVSGTEGFTGSTVELAFALLLGITRNLPAELASVHAGGWQTAVGRDLKGMRLGVLGLGTLGSKMARIASAFEMEVAGWSRNNTPERCAALGIGYAPDLDTLLAASDVVSIHLTLTPETRGLLDIRRIGLMRPDSILINTSRGPIVDESAIMEAVIAGRIHAGFDVFDIEPLPADHPFRRAPNLLATPHLGYVTDRTYDAFYRGAVEAITAWQRGAPIRVLARPSA